MRFEDMTGGQFAFFMGYAVIFVLWALSEWKKRTADAKHHRVDDEDPASQPVEMPHVEEKKPENEPTPADHEGCHARTTDHSHQQPAEAPAAPTAVVPATSNAAAAAPAAEERPKVPLFHLDNPMFNVLMLGSDALVKHNGALRMMAEFGAHMVFMFVADRTDIWAEAGEKHYSRDMFFFLYFLLVLFAFYTSLGRVKDARYLNRDQTEEWKGWMQVLFLMYHYFEAKEQYNSLRVYIAAYVWMTGFGNYSYYGVRKDFSPSRFFQMLWRLNFLVFWACVVMGNDYMLYYICPMHTLWTIVLYIALLIGNKHNANLYVVWTKWTLCLIFVTVFWFEDIFYAVWRPFQFIVGFKNPYHPDTDLLHEWYFRSGLDRYVWIFGMMCAQFHPPTERLLLWIDEQEFWKRTAMRAAIVLVLGSIGVAWAVNVLSIEGHYNYNSVHPYTSFIPIGIFIILRNLTPTLRSYHLGVFAWLGKITLETYIGQFHLWLHTAERNHSPKHLWTVLPNYEWLNFLLVTPLYIMICYRLFHLTNDLKLEILPSRDTPRLSRNLVLVLLGWLPLYGLGHALRYATR